MIKRTVPVFLSLLLCVLLFLGGPFSFRGGSASAAEKEMRGIWVSVFDFPKLGFDASSESAFIKNADKFLTEAKANGINTVFLHVRAFDDAIYPSKPLEEINMFPQLMIH